MSEEVQLTAPFKAFLLIATIGISFSLGYLIYPVTNQTPTEETPLIRIQWASMRNNWTVYNWSWYWVSEWGNNEVLTPPTLTDSCWWALGDFYFVTSNSGLSDPHCNMTVTISPIREYGNLSIERLSIIYQDGFDYDGQKVFDIYGNPDASFSLRTIDGFKVILWGIGNETSSVYGDVHFFTPEIRISEFVVYSGEVD
ncbi:MAG: hypothetical protein ACFFF4_09970 [Candidatus Thorarchaeota archaeon]